MSIKVFDKTILIKISNIPFYIEAEKKPGDDIRNLFDRKTYARDGEERSRSPPEAS